METVQLNHLNHCIFKTFSPTITDLTVINQPEADNGLSSPIPYTEIMLCEYYHMVNSLTKLDDSQIQSLQDEVNKVLTKLTKWLDKAGSINAIELFSSMRHLKQKANASIKVITQKSSIINNKNINIMKNFGYMGMAPANSYIKDKQ